MEQNCFNENPVPLDSRIKTLDQYNKSEEQNVIKKHTASKSLLYLNSSTTVALQLKVHKVETDTNKHHTSIIKYLVQTRNTKK